MKLGINIDHVATIRQARRVAYPDIVAAAAAAEAGGADFITVHLREDRRHIVDDDLPRLQTTLATHMNLEIAATDEMRDIALSLRPASICIVPEKRREVTTEGGVDVVAARNHLHTFCAPLAAAGMEVSLFVDPDEKQIAAAAACGVHAVELHTGAYAENGDIAPIAAAAAAAAAAGLKTNAGHGLRLDNVAAIAALPLAELNIGHAVVARALFIGLTEAVREMRTAMGLPLR